LAGEDAKEPAIAPQHQARFPGRRDFIGRQLRFAYIHLMEELDRGTADAFPDVTPAMKQVLMFVERDGNRLTELAELAGMTKQAMGEHVDGLVQLGLLERVPDPDDGRAKLIRPTADGVQCMSYAFDVAVGVHEHWKRLLGARKAQQLLNLLKELNAKLEEEVATQAGDGSDTVERVS
jgi:DNA-binding MarR family transcriptional regulator